MAKRKTTPQTRQKLRRASRKKWLSASYARKTLKKALQHREDLPNESEKLLLSFLDAIEPGYWRYVGDGQFFIMRFNPDFVNIQDKRIIEFNGCFWHACPECFPKKKSQEEKMTRRIAIFKSYGYQTIVIWEHELKKGAQHVRQKLRDSVVE